MTSKSFKLQAPQNGSLPQDISMKEMARYCGKREHYAECLEDDFSLFGTNLSVILLKLSQLAEL